MKIKLLFATIVLFFILFLVLIFFSFQKTSTIAPESSVPTTSPLEGGSSLKAPNEAEISPDELEEITNKITGERSYTQKLAEVRSDLIKDKTGETKIIFEHELLRISYISKVDAFHAEILSSDVKSAKKKLFDFFSEKQLSRNEICNLPLLIYRDPKIFDPALTAGMEFYSCNEDL